MYPYGSEKVRPQAQMHPLSNPDLRFAAKWCIIMLRYLLRWRNEANPKDTGMIESLGNAPMDIVQPHF